MEGLLERLRVREQGLLDSPRASGRPGACPSSLSALSQPASTKASRGRGTIQLVLYDKGRRRRRECASATCGSRRVPRGR